MTSELRFASLRNPSFRIQGPRLVRRVGRGEFRPFESSSRFPYDPVVLERVLSHGVIPNRPWEELAVFVDEPLATVSHLERTSVREPGRSMFGGR